MGICKNSSNFFGSCGTKGPILALFKEVVLMAGPFSVNAPC